jgi:hypothetical protein
VPGESAIELTEQTKNTSSSEIIKILINAQGVDQESNQEILFVNGLKIAVQNGFSVVPRGT